MSVSSRADERTRVVKHDESFGVFDPAGMIPRQDGADLGVFHRGTRFLSMFELAIARRAPVLLGSTVRRDGVLVVHLGSPDIPDLAGGALERDQVHVAVTSFLWNAAWHARFAIHNYARREIQLAFDLHFDADFADVFEVRGMQRARRGVLREPAIEKTCVTLGYDGLDGRARLMRLELSTPPHAISGHHARYELSLSANQEVTLEACAMFLIDAVPAHCSFERALAGQTEDASSRTPQSANIDTTNELVDAWVERSSSDIQMMLTKTEHGAYPYAGVPWYSAPFGRDGIITAYEMLWLDPMIARGVLQFLSATQATTDDPERDAEVGKIVHEVRHGEMAALGEVPFGRYYGSVDATPLFVMLAAEYWKRTADRDAIAALWPHVQRALAWIDTRGDLDGDGFVEYASRTSRGLVSQGWKDSYDAISHADGTLARAPVALCEVQAYVYAARRGAAELARVLGHLTDAHRLDSQAEELRARFERMFWSDKLGTYVLALDADKRPCEVRASNAGHALWCGIASPQRAKRVCEALFEPSSFSGWGIRTLDSSVSRFNPISYHNGSIWPHDNAIVAAGLARYGFKPHCAQLFGALGDASHHFDLDRMPELFCGFDRESSEGPTLYPVACAPQAWAAGSVFLLLQSCLGIVIDAPARRVLLERPQLPANISRVTIRDLRVGEASIDIVCRRHADDIGVELVRRVGNVELAVVK
ncbi:MAG TPA: glycogen debranching N-terminal domain-containing protein [Kofleriaceae bacterium]